MCSADDHALQEILDTVDVRERLSAALVLLKKEVELGKLQADIGRRVEGKISGDQRRYFLTEQLKSIKKELGMERDDKTALAEKFMDKFAPFRDRAPAHAVKTIEEELQKLAGLEPSSSEFNVGKGNYLEWLTSVPWGALSEERLDIAQAREVLDADHYGLDDVKGASWSSSPSASCAAPRRGRSSPWWARRAWARRASARASRARWTASFSASPSAV